ncbi:MAG TPA: HAD family hydrolase [Nitrospirae bacterium]|nr:phosphoglycolate phosphatase [bacterium BMS3Abin09]GBE41750.1 phosphoglycolate phosphatase [bacterium BMS3Bbin09]HDZ84310.1 HAD family hydrolase [Nitrospirota bacterium]
MLKLLIFDLDGTLADTAQDITDALNYCVEPFGGKKYSVEETMMMVGSGLTKFFSSLVQTLKGGDSPEALEIITRRYIDFYSVHLMDNTRLYPHVKETLSKLIGYKMAILSNKREGFSRKILGDLGILEHFEILWGSDSVREKKPSPVPILNLMEKFGVSKEETAIIGDSNFDVEAGRAAGIKVIGVTYGFRDRSYLEGSDFIIDGFDKLSKIIPNM